MCQEVVNSQLALSPRGHENHNRFGGRVFFDGEVGRFRHGDHKRRGVVDSNWIWIAMSSGRALKNSNTINKMIKRYRIVSTNPGQKLKMVCSEAPIHFPRSSAFARETPRTTIRLIPSLEVGPTSPPTFCTSSAIKRPRVCTFLRCRHLWKMTSHYERRGIEISNKIRTESEQL